MAAKRGHISFIILFALMVYLLMRVSLPFGPAPEPTSYSAFLTYLRAGRIDSVQIQTERLIARVRSDSARIAPRLIVVNRLPEMDESALIAELRARGVKFNGETPSAFPWGPIIIAWLPLALLFLLYFYGTRQMSARSSGPLSFGRAKAKVYDKSASISVTFDDVAGVDEAKAELEEVVSFLKDPTRYQALGARIPKGVLLVGPPGTGKTLLARAVAGQAAVPFFSLTGSEFVEMFVGVGAARIRSLFEQAKERAPCIIFIDELDAIGRTRAGATAFAAHEEREQTLNQLLAEMDGFDPGRGVIIMAATNRPEVLDPALLRPGRFDRQVMVDRPDLNGRIAILRVHARKVKLGAGVDLESVAHRTVGMTGADLANIVNEAALAAGRRGGSEVGSVDFEEAVDRVQLGLKKRGRAMSEHETRRVAYHEAGHALVAMSVAHADPVHRVTIIPRSIGALGATLQLPTEDRYLITRDELLDRVCVMLGGRSAEEVACDDISTGAHNDLERASETARQMVARFGMSEALGPVTYGHPVGARFLETPLSIGEERNFSEETARRIDHEVDSLIAEQHTRARSILSDRRDALERIVGALLKKETIERAELEQLLHPAPPDQVEATPVAAPLAGDADAATSSAQPAASC